MGYTNTGKNKSLQRYFIELKIIPCLYYISCSFKPVWMGIYRSRRLRTGRWQFLACIYSNFSIRLCLLLGRRKYMKRIKGEKSLNVEDTTKWFDIDFIQIFRVYTRLWGNFAAWQPILNFIWSLVIQIYYLAYIYLKLFRKKIMLSSDIAKKLS